jgi:hypothetical protein
MTPDAAGGPKPPATQPLPPLPRRRAPGSGSRRTRWATSRFPTAPTTASRRRAASTTSRSPARGRTRPWSGRSSRSRRPRPGPTWPPAACPSSSATPSSRPPTRSSARPTPPEPAADGRARAEAALRPDAGRLRGRPGRQAGELIDNFRIDPFQAGAGHQPQHERQRGAGQPGHRTAARRRRRLGQARRLLRRQPQRPRQHGPVDQRRLPDVDAHRHAGPDPRLHAGRRGADRTPSSGRPASSTTSSSPAERTCRTPCRSGSARSSPPTR